MEKEAREYQKTIAYLCELVKTGELALGSKLPTERKLAETLSIGRNSIREALRVLENMGMLECRQGSGNYIAGNMAKTIAEMVEMMLLLRKITKEEVIAFRRDMEKVICSSIIANGSMERWDKKLTDILAADMEEKSLEEQIAADWDFHYTLILAAENQLWICISEAIICVYQTWMECVLQAADSATKIRLQHAHRALLLALQEGSKEAAFRAIDVHYDLVDEKLKVS